MGDWFWNDLGFSKKNVVVVIEVDMVKFVFKVVIFDFVVVVNFDIIGV